jgi:hypothetical protein
MIPFLDQSTTAVAERGPMAKKKAEPKGQKTLFAVKGSDEWFDWLKRYADSVGVSAMVAIDLALKDKAKRDGFPEPMPKRIGSASRKDAAG